MDFSMLVALSVYLGVPVLLAIWLAHKTVRVIDLVREIVSNWQRARLSTEMFDLQVLTSSDE